MDIEVIKALASLPLEAVLIYLIIRQQSQIEKLLACMVENERNHTRDLLEVLVSRGGSVDDRSTDRESNKVFPKV